jgi:uncharacterized protein
MTEASFLGKYRVMNAMEPAPNASVLLGFRAENTRSFRDEFELSMLATRLADEDAVRYVTWREDGRPIGILPIAGIFGANASGKTNVVRAMDDMRAYVLHSFRAGSPTGGISRRPYLLEPDGNSKPSRFEVDLVLGGICYEYGFIIDDESVREEWVYRYSHGKAARIFHRHGSDMEFGASGRAKSRAVAELLRPNALYLSTAASANHPALLPLYGWFARNFVLAEENTRQLRQALTTQLLNDDGRRQPVLALLRAAAMGITGAKTQPLDPITDERIQKAVRILVGLEIEADGTDEGPKLDDLGLRLVHRGADSDVDLDPHDESFGTLVWFGLVGSVIEALAQGTVLLADELDASLHPNLVRQLIRLFQSPESNPRRAQLVFNSHDMTILGDSAGDRLIGRDQIWFTEKGDDGSTRLYSLADLEPRKSEAIGRRYLAGHYGATPNLSSQEFEAAAKLVGRP